MQILGCYKFSKNRNNQSCRATYDLQFCLNEFSLDRPSLWTTACQTQVHWNYKPLLDRNAYKSSYNFHLITKRLFNVYPRQTRQFPKSVQKFQRVSISGDQLLTAIIVKPFSLLLWKFDTSNISKLSTTLLLTIFIANSISPMQFT